MVTYAVLEPFRDFQASPPITSFRCSPLNSLGEQDQPFRSCGETARLEDKVTTAAGILAP